MKLPDGYNIHHPDFRRRDYNKHPVTRTLREMGKLTVAIEAHNELHANVPPLPRMSLDLARYSIDVIRHHRIGEVESLHGLALFEARLQAYDTLGRCRGRLAEEARTFGEHFEQQHEYLRGATWTT